MQPNREPPRFEHTANYAMIEAAKEAYYPVPWPPESCMLFVQRFERGCLIGRNAISTPSAL